MAPGKYACRKDVLGAKKCWCRECTLKYNRQYWHTNKNKLLKDRPKYYPKAREYVRKKRLENKVKLFQYTGTKCVRCGFDNPKALQFHHKDSSTKKFGVLGKLSREFSFDWDEIFKEVEKCELLCANCHQIERNNVCDLDVLRNLISNTD